MKYHKLTPTPQSVSAILFDFDGVMVNRFTVKSVQQFCKTFSVEEVEFQRFSRHAAQGLDRGIKREQDYFAALVRKFTLSCTSRALQKFFITADRINIQPRKAMFDLVRSLRKEYHTVLLTNVSRELAVRMRRMKLYDDFEKKFFSYHIGLAKPDRKFFSHVLNALRISPEEAIFIDDSTTNVQSARKCGIHSILYKNPTQVTRALRRILRLRQGYTAPKKHTI